MSRVYGLKIEGMTMTDVQSIDLPPCNFTLPDNLYGGALEGYVLRLSGESLRATFASWQWPQETMT